MYIYSNTHTHLYYCQVRCLLLFGRDSFDEHIQSARHAHQVRICMI